MNRVFNIKIHYNKIVFTQEEIDKMKSNVEGMTDIEALDNLFNESKLIADDTTFEEVEKCEEEACEKCHKDEGVI